VGFNPLFISSTCVQIPVTWLNTFYMVVNNIFTITSRSCSLMYRYTGCFTTCGHYCRRWFPRSLWSKKFI